MQADDEAVTNAPEEPRPPRAYEHGRYQWNLNRVPETIVVGGRSEEHPARDSAIFVVHGIGDQRWTAIRV